MPQMMPCWWLLIQFYVVLLFMVVFVEIYYSFAPCSSEKNTSMLKNNLLSNFSLKSLLNE